MRVLVTGATGFVGSHLLEQLVEQPDLELHATRRWSARMDLVRAIPHLESRVRWHTSDLTDPFSVDAVVGRVRPERLFHLGAQSYVSPSWEAPEVYFRTNVLGSIYLLEALRRHGLESCRVLIPGSGEEYGEVDETHLPILPDTPLRPLNPYAVSKVAQDLLGFVHHKSYGLQVVRIRAFNHEGPRRDRVFALPSFAWQIARIEQGLSPARVLVGNLEARRCWTDVRDMVRAYRLAIEQCPPGELFLIGSQDVRSVRECLEELLRMTTHPRPIQIEVDPALVRPTEPMHLMADTGPFCALTGWRPEIHFDRTLADTLEYWRSRVRQKMD